MSGTYQEKFMQLAIKEARTSVRRRDGGPFGAVVVKNGKVVASGHNHVLKNNDSTRHGEIDAIRKAERKLRTYDLSGCEIYTTGEPCPMCLSALYWAGVERIFYGNTKEDAKAINFDDSFIYDQIALDYSERSIPCINIMREQALAGFKAWSDKEDKVLY